MWPSDEADAARFLMQAGFGGKANDRARVMQMGFSAWIDEQLKLPRQESRFDRATTMKQSDLPQYNVNWESTYNIIWRSALGGSDSLRQRMTFALSEILVVNYAGTDIDHRIKTQALVAYMDLLEKHAFGNYRLLLEDVTLNPAMGRMLGVHGNAKEDAKGRRPDENYAREVMQLFSIGLHELNLDGTYKLNAQGEPIEAYGADTITNMARVFTGWNGMIGFDSANPNAELGRTPMTCNNKNHSLLEKSFLGVTIPANTDGPNSLKIALDTLFNHSNIAPFISKQLIQRFITSNPSSAYVGRVAAVFVNNGQGIRGDLAAVLKAILLDQDARRAPSLYDPYAGKVMEPMIRLGCIVRSLPITSPDSEWRLANFANGLGQQPMNAPSVFNFFRPGYVPPNTLLASQGLVAPELQIMNERSTLLQVEWFHDLIRVTADRTQRSYMVGNTAKRRDNRDPDYKEYLAKTGLQMNWQEELRLAGNPVKLIDYLNLQLAAGQLHRTTRQFISSSINKLPINAVDKTAQQTQLLNRVQAAVLMVLAAPESQVLL